MQTSISNVVPSKNEYVIQTVIRFLVVVMLFSFYYITQSMIDSLNIERSLSIDDEGIIVDELLNILPTISSKHVKDAILITSSLFIDITAIAGTIWCVFSSSHISFRPTLEIGGCVLLRQLMRWLVSLPIPPNIYWSYPGFPSLMVGYGVETTDLFFSGHTVAAIIGAHFLQLCIFNSTIYTKYILRKYDYIKYIIYTAIFLFAFYEMFVVLLMRCHWTMDVYTGMMTAFCMILISDSHAKKLDATIKQIARYINNKFCNKSISERDN